MSVQWINAFHIALTTLVGYVPVIATVVTCIFSVILARATLRYVEATDKSLTHWKLLPPLFGGIGVQEQMELPHIIYQKGTYYLFTSTHNRTFVEGLKYQYPEGMYGFHSTSLQGPFTGDNGTGVVLADPPSNSLQNYAWKAIPIGNGKVEVMSFINQGNSGTISPAVQLALNGGSVKLTGLQTTPDGKPVLPLVFGVDPTEPPSGSVVVSSVTSTPKFRLHGKTRSIA